VGNAARITQTLLKKAAAAPPSELVDVVVELVPGGAGSGATPAERMAALDRAFQQRASAVEEAIREAGGHVVERLWINDCLRVRVPASALSRLARLELVSTLDTPHAITRER
jgi:hypothetical protein